MARKKIEESHLSNSQRKYLLAFKGRGALGEFENLIVKAWFKADLNNQRALAKAFAEIAEGFRLYMSGEFI